MQPFLRAPPAREAAGSPIVATWRHRTDRGSLDTAAGLPLEPWPPRDRIGSDKARRRRSPLLRDPGRRIKVMRIHRAMPPGCDMASKKALNPRNLEALGAERPAELLIQISTGKSAARRLLRLELAGAEGTAELAREVRHRLATIGRSRAILDWRKARDLVDSQAPAGSAARRCLPDRKVRRTTPSSGHALRGSHRAPPQETP